MTSNILPLVLLVLYIALTYWSCTIIYEVGNDIRAELTHLGMLVIAIWVIATAVGAAWALF
jgi:hypothetical protein